MMSLYEQRHWFHPSSASRSETRDALQGSRSWMSQGCSSSHQWCFEDSFFSGETVDWKCHGELCPVGSAAALTRSVFCSTPFCSHPLLPSCCLLLEDGSGDIFFLQRIPVSAPFRQKQNILCWSTLGGNSKWQWLSRGCGTGHTQHWYLQRKWKLQTIPDQWCFP